MEAQKLMHKKFFIHNKECLKMIQSSSGKPPKQFSDIAMELAIKAIEHSQQFTKMRNYISVATTLQLLNWKMYKEPKDYSQKLRLSSLQAHQPEALLHFSGPIISNKGLKQLISLLYQTEEYSLMLLSFLQGSIPISNPSKPSSISQTQTSLHQFLNVFKTTHPNLNAVCWRNNSTNISKFQFLRYNPCMISGRQKIFLDLVALTKMMILHYLHVLKIRQTISSNTDKI